MRDAAETEEDPAVEADAVDVEAAAVAGDD